MTLSLQEDVTNNYYDEIKEDCYKYGFVTLHKEIRKHMMNQKQRRLNF